MTSEHLLFALGFLAPLAIVAIWVVKEKVLGIKPGGQPSIFAEMVGDLFWTLARLTLLLGSAALVIWGLVASPIVTLLALILFVLLLTRNQGD